MTEKSCAAGREMGRSNKDPQWSDWSEPCPAPVAETLHMDTGTEVVTLYLCANHFAQLRAAVGNKMRPVYMEN